MGYYTYYTLSAQLANRDPNGKLVLSSIDMLPRNEIEKLNAEVQRLDIFCAGKGGDWDSADTFKWYDHDEDMIALSYKFPSVLFTLYGDGEESEDFWYAYYLNGSMQFCPARITYDPFNEFALVKNSDPKLKDPNRRYSYES